VQSCAAWRVAGGKVPRVSEICCAVMAERSGADFPTSISVRSELHAMAATQPWVLKRAAVMRPVLSRTARRRTSPQTGFVTSTVALASKRSPALCGARK